VKYEDYRQSILKEVNSPILILAEEGRFELINPKDEEEFLCPDLLEKHDSEGRLNNSFIKNALINDELFERNSISYLINLYIKH
jgi:hypothetical protein